MSNVFNFVSVAVVALTMSLVSGCTGSGGGGDGGSVNQTSAIVINTHPANQSVTAGSTATFEVVASNATNYQWQVSKDGGTTFTNIGGAVAESYTTPATTLDDNKQQFRVVVSGASSTVTSNAATLTVTASVVSAPAITTQPTNQSVVTGATATFTVVASDAIAYQWQRSTDGGILFTDIAGATAASYTTPVATLADNNQQFRVMVSAATTSLTSNAATLTVTAVNVSTVLYERSYSYVAVSNILTVKDDGAGMVWLTSGTDKNDFAALTPTKQIIYRHVSSSLPQESGLYIMNQDGSGKTALIANDATAFYEGQSESGRIIYSRYVAGNYTDLYSVNADGTGTMAISATTDGDYFKCSISGDRVIYQGYGLRSAKADGSASVQLTANVAGRNEQFIGADGSGRVVFSSYETTYGTGTGGIYRVSPDGGTASALAIATIAYEYDVAGITRTGRVVLSGTSGAFPNRLIDESGTSLVEVVSGGVDYMGSTALGQVIYSKRPDGTAGSSVDLYITEATGANTVALAIESGVDENFEYVTDSGRVIYSTSAGLYAVNTDGTARNALALNNNVSVVFKAVHGNLAIYEQTEGGSVTYLYAVKLDGTGTIPLLNSGGSAFFSGITPGGKILVRREPASVDLWVVNADGTNPLPLANSGDNEIYRAAFQ